jgi:hypothetical protein
LAVGDGHPEEVREFGMGTRPALEPRVRSYVGQPLGRGFVQHRGEYAVLAGQRADGLPLVVRHAVHHELGEAAVVVGDAEGGVLSVQQVTGRGDDRLEDVAHFELSVHREDRGADSGEP